MKKNTLDKIEKILKEEKKELVNIDTDVHKIEYNLVERTPSKFSYRDLARSFFGALIVSFGFVLKGALVKTAVNFSIENVIGIIIASLTVLIIEVFYFGYRKIKDKHSRRLGQFILKRVPTFYLVSLLVAGGLVYLYGINNDPLIMASDDIINVIIAISFPASLGAGVADLIKKY